MKKLTLLMLAMVIFIIASCRDSGNDTSYYKSSKLPLRQLVQQTEKTKTSYASYFLIAGSYSSREETKIVVRAFANVNGRFRLLEMPLSDIRIKIDNSIVSPYIIVEFNTTTPGNNSTEELLNTGWISKVYVINCPEKYLPEKLLPIGL